MGNNPSSDIGFYLPVDNVSWFEAIEFCNRKSNKDGLESCYYGKKHKVVCDYSKKRIPFAYRS